MVDALDAALRRRGRGTTPEPVSRGARVTPRRGESGPTTSRRAWSTRAGGARRGRSTPGDRRGASTGDRTVAWSFLRLQRLPGAQRPPRRGGGGPRALDRWGAGSGPPAWSPAPAPSTPSSRRRWPSGRGPRPRWCFPTGFAANLGVLAVLAGPGVRVLSDELNHASIIDGCRLSRAASPCTATVTSTTSRTASATARRAAPTGPPRDVVVTDTVFSMDGDVAPVDELAGPVPPARRTAGARRGPCRARPHPATDRDGAGAGRDRERGERSCGWARCPRRWGRWAASWPAARDVVDLLGQPGPLRTSSRRAHPGRRRRRPGRLRVLRSAEGDALTARLASLVDRLSEAGLVPPDHPSPIVPVVLGAEQAALEASASLLEQGPVGAGHPPAHRAGRHQPAARHPVGGAHRRGRDPAARCAGPPVAVPRPSPGRPLDRRASPTGWSWSSAPAPMWARRGWRPGSWPSCGRGARWRPASRRSPSIRVTTRRIVTPQSSAPPAGSRPRRCARLTAGTRWPWRRPWRPRRWDVRRSRAPTWSASLDGRATRRRRAGRDGRRGAVPAGRRR